MRVDPSPSPLLPSSPSSSFLPLFPSPRSRRHTDASLGGTSSHALPLPLPPSLPPSSEDTSRPISPSTIARSTSFRSPTAFFATPSSQGPFNFSSITR